jgi:hypothetical protein
VRVHKWRYSLFFSTSIEAGELLVLACFHSQRNPKHRQGRVS